ncbi:MAG: family 43 glycosylhydrolase [Bacteroidota bacterium]
MPRCIYVLVFLFLMSNTKAQRLVLPGDFPDPSIAKIGDSYYASATTSNWMPAFPILKSNDLVNWKLVDHAFKELPEWADYYFWAPEISYDNGKVYLYYSAHKKGGNLCVGIASADKPEGPFKDHGPIICEAAGSIDAFPMRDEKGKLHIIWKEDGNSVRKPTPIWIQELNEERTAVLGEKKLLFLNDLPWEANLVEGVSMMRHGQYIYAFYAAAGCCGIGCTYQSGIARSKSLAGPWEKYANNPVLVNEAQWRCPGHGTPVEKDNKFYFLYHAYDSAGTVYTGRQGLVKEFVFTADGWVKFVDAPQAPTKPIQTKTDLFNGSVLQNDWQWSVFTPAKTSVANGLLSLDAVPGGANYVAQKTLSPNYKATAEINSKKSTASAGISLVGDEKNQVTAYLRNNRIELVQTRQGKDSVLLTQAVSRSKKTYLAMQVANGKDISFFVGKNQKALTPLNAKPIDGTFLPPWDRALRVALIAKAGTAGTAMFDSFEMEELAK